VKLRFFFILSLLLHLTLVWFLRPKEFPVQDLSEVQILEALPATGEKKNSEPSSRSQKSPISQAKSISQLEPSLSKEAPKPEAVADSPQGASGNLEAVSVGAVTEPPKVLKEKKIPYPVSAERAGIEGVVELLLVINAEGIVESAEVIRGPGYGLNEAALAAIKEFVFSPAKIGSNKVSIRWPYKYRFYRGGSL